MNVVPGSSAALVDAIAAGRSPDDLEVRVFVPLAPGDRTERPITVDQTNVSVVVGERAVVKWMRTPGDARAPRLLAHLAAAGFTRMPTPHAAAFRDGDLVALVTAFLPAAEDGWDWCTDDLLSWLDGGPPAGFAPALGTLAADLHAALATPSPVQPSPLAAAAVSTDTPAPATAPARADDTARDAEPARHSAAGTLAEALASAGDDDDGAWVHSIADLISADMSVLSGYCSPAPVLQLHGDLHVGQILRYRGGHLAVTDFDGNPTKTARPEPAARDLAQLRTSVLHVAEIANRRTEGRHRGALLDWGRQAADDLLAAYRTGLDRHGVPQLLDEKLLRPFEVEQECRELIYAARFLPRWRYAPLGVLRSWYG
jgi:maltokinase